MYEYLRLFFRRLTGHHAIAVFGLLAAAFIASSLHPAPVAAATTTPEVYSSVARTPVLAPLGIVAAENVNTTASDEEIVCIGGALGYITCPLLDISAKMVQFIAVLLDVVFNFQALNNDAIRGVWSIFANLANIALAVVFLIVIMSQASSIGISNYGIKRMLPRIVAAAILINMSFYVCALAVDLSNVLGHNMMGFIGTLTQDELAQSNPVAKNTPACKVIAESAGRSGAEAWSWTAPGLISQAVGVDDDIENAAGSVGGFVGGLFGNKTVCTMAVVAVGLTSGISVITLIIAIILIAVFIAFITTLALAFMRYTLLIFLVMLAPLAFAAWILPGTEGLFKKWWNLFLKLLMIYPMAMFMFGASMFAANVIGVVVNNGEFISSLFPDSNITKESIDAVWAALQLFIIAMPLFFIPKLFKSMDSITGGLAGKMAAAGTLGGLIGGVKKGVRTYNKGNKMYGNTEMGRYRNQMKAEDTALAVAGRYKGTNKRLLAKQEINAALRGMSPGFDKHATANARNTTERREAEDASGFKQDYGYAYDRGGEAAKKNIKSIAKGERDTTTGQMPSVAQMRAAQDVMFAREQFKDLQEVKDHVDATPGVAQETYYKSADRNMSSTWPKAPHLTSAGDTALHNPTGSKVASFKPETIDRLIDISKPTASPVGNSAEKHQKHREQTAAAFEQALKNKDAQLNYTEELKAKMRAHIDDVRRVPPPTP